MARRKGRVWYIAALSGPDPVNVTVDLSPWKIAGAKGEVLTSLQGRSFHVAPLALDSTDSIQTALKAGDGVVIRITTP